MSYQAGWYGDPTGRFDHRYYDGSTWTDHVAQGGEAAVDTLHPPASASRSDEAVAAAIAPVEPVTPTAVPATEAATASPVGAAARAAGGTKELPDDPAGASRRRAMGWLMMGAGAVVLVSLFLPWIAAAEDASRSAVPKELAGYQLEAGWFCALLAIGLGVYGWQGVGRARVRFNIGALIAVIFLVATAMLAVVTASDAVLEKLDAEPPSTEVFDAGPISVEQSDSGDDVFANADAVERRTGADLAFLAALVTIIPLVLLWRDDRRRRAQLLQTVPVPVVAGVVPGVVAPAASVTPVAEQLPAAAPASADPEPIPASPDPEPTPPPADRQAAWHPDPTGRFDQRYFDGSTWTEHVAQGEEQAVDPLDRPAPAKVPATGGAAADGGQRRKRMSLVMLGCGLVVVLAAFLPWGTSKLGGDDLGGFEWGPGKVTALMGLGLCVYAAQGLSASRARVQFHGWVVALISVNTVTALFANAAVDTADTVTFGAAGLEPGWGLNLTLLVGLAAIWPLVVLWRDDRREQRVAPAGISASA